MKAKIILTAAIALFLIPASLDSASTNLDLSSWIERNSSTHIRPAGLSAESNNHYRSRSAFQSMDVKYDGDITIADNDRSIKSISPGGYLKISIRTFGNSRELLVNSSSGGTLTYEFKEGRKEVPFEPEGRRWLADVLIDVVRSTSIDAEGRAQRIYDDGGVDAFLDEISHISSSTVKVAYFSALLDKGGLSNSELSELAYAITGKITSSTYCGRLLRKYNSLFLRDPDVAAAYFSSISKITSSTEKGRTYRAVEQPIDLSHYSLRIAYFAGVDRISSRTEA